ncbi:hypothetical protein ACH5RR_030081 [Cinchona calisaya]|uniref:Uncharacterized protein n=1 Tax=Cinchona calisaya TaxID=153742 RepID=A0ABD2YTI7_9GENT
MTGIPCVHACATLVNSDKEATYYVHPYYSVHYYKLAYKHVIMPIPFKEDWVQTGKDPTEPPEIKKRPGRPRKVRRKGIDEQRNATVGKGWELRYIVIIVDILDMKGCGERSNQTSVGNNGSTYPIQSQMETHVTQSSTSSRGKGSHSRKNKSRNENISFSNANPSSSRGRSIGNTGSESSRGRGINTSGGRECVNPSPYLGIGNWNGIEMSSGTHFMPVNRITRQISNKLQAMCLTYKGCYNWDDEIKWQCRHWSSKDLRNQFKRLVLATTIYTIWRFRNEAILKGRRVIAIGVIATVIDSVRYTIVSWGKIPRASENLELVLE